MGRRVITLDQSAFDEVCSRLERSVMMTGFVPDAILAIATGGVYVANKIFPNIPHAVTRRQRPTTKNKNRFVKGIIKRLPVNVLDAMRVAEASVLEKLPVRPIDPSLIKLPELAGYSRILIVDDAVDSGATLQCVYKAVRNACPEADVRSAVITVTTAKPLIKPDFSLFSNYILIRFPWSMDS